MTGPVIVNRQRRYRIPVVRMQRFANTLARRLRIEHLEFSLVLSNDRAIRRLNRNFRQKDRSTDILSFPAQDPVPAGADLDNPYLVRRNGAQTGFRQKSHVGKRALPSDDSRLAASPWLQP